jgi:hypothetical protein
VRIVSIDLILYFFFQQVLCHCFDCRKLTGTLYTYNFVVKIADLKITGSPKEVAKTSDSGNHIKNYFCSDCGVYYKTEFGKALTDDTRRNAALWAENEVYRNP